MVGLILLVMLLPLTVSSEDDPCNNYTMLYDDGGRSINCDRYYSDSHDRFIDEGWKRVQLQPTGEDLTMPTQCVPHGYCGSHSNVWLDGTHPTVEDGIVNRTGCLCMFSSCCKVQYPIQIKNCTDYMVYNLMRTFGSDERYCFGNSTLCYQTTTKTPRPTTVSPTTKTSRPTTISSTTKTSRQTTISSTTKTSHPTTVSPTTKTSSPTTVSSTTKTSRPTTVSSTTKTLHPTTMSSTNEKFKRTTTVDNEMKPSSVNDNDHDSQKAKNVHDELDMVSEYETGEMVMILGVCLSITMALLFILVVGIFFYLRRRNTGIRYELDTKSTKA